jgi:hypothetical protein
MAKNILRRQFSNVYGKDKVIPTKNSIESLLSKMNSNESNSTQGSNTKGPQLKRIMKNEFKNVYDTDAKAETNVNVNRKIFPEIKPSNVTISAVIFLTVSLLLVTIIYYYRNTIMDFFKNIQGKINVDTSKTVSQLENKYDSLFDNINKKIEKEEKEVDELKTKISTHELSSIHKDEKINKEKDQKIESGGVGTLNSKIQTKYKDKQIVKGNGFCYIGFDNHMRECTDVYEGDICMSGQIFPTLDKCLNPEFR